jgi:hypothetical protein
MPLNSAEAGFPDIPLFNALLDGLSTLLAYGVDVLVELAIPKI